MLVPVRSVCCALGLMVLTVATFTTEPIQIQSVPLQIQPPRDRPPDTRVGTGSLRGFVIDAHTGSVMARVRVRLSGSGQRPPVLTDGEGVFTFTGLPSGTYMLSAEKSTYMTARYPEAGAMLRAGRQPLMLRDGEARGDVVIRMFHGGALAGRVVDAHGDPVEYADVRALRIPRGGRPTMVSGQSTNDLGEFRVPRLEPGQYVLFVQPRRVTEEPALDTELPPQPVPTYYPGVASFDHAQRIGLERGQTIGGIELTLAEGRHTIVTGLVVSADGQPVGTNVSIGTRQGLDPASGYTSGWGTGMRQDGTFRLQLPPGEFVIEARVLPQLKPGDTIRPMNERFGRVRLIAGINPVENVVIQVGPGASASGRVVFDGAAPPAQTPTQPIHMPLYSQDGGCRPGQVTLARDWSFKVDGLFGTCSAPMQSMFGQWTLKSVLFRGRDLLEGPVTFEVGQQLTDVQVVFTNRRTELELRVSDERGEPTREYVALVFPADKEKWKDLTRHVRTHVPPQMSPIMPGRGGGPPVPAVVVGGISMGVVGGVVGGRSSGSVVTSQLTSSAFQPRVVGLPAGDYYVVAVDDIESEATRDPAVLERLIPSALRVALTDAAKAEVDLRRVILTDVIR